MTALTSAGGERHLASIIGPSAAAVVRELLIEAATAGYAEICPKHDPDRGWDAQLFGIAVWKATVFALAQAVEDLDDDRFSILRPSGSLVLRVDAAPFAAEIGFWRQGADGDLELETFGGSFTKDRFAANGAQQLSLTEVRRLPHLTPTAFLAAGHDGTPQTGLQTITIGLPQSSKATPWLWRDVLWTASRTTSADPDSPPPADITPLSPTPPHSDGPSIAVSLKRPARAEPAS